MLFGKTGTHLLRPSSSLNLWCAISGTSLRDRSRWYSDQPIPWMDWRQDRESVQRGVVQRNDSARTALLQGEKHQIKIQEQHVFLETLNQLLTVSRWLDAPCLELQGTLGDSYINNRSIIAQNGFKLPLLVVSLLQTTPQNICCLINHVIRSRPHDWRIIALREHATWIYLWNVQQLVGNMRWCIRHGVSGARPWLTEWLGCIIWFGNGCAPGGMGNDLHCSGYLLIVVSWMDGWMIAVGWVKNAIEAGQHDVFK